MRRFLSLVLTTLMLIFMTLTVQAAQSKGKALIVHGGADSIGIGDAEIGDRLMILGFDTVDYLFAPNTTDTSWKGYDVVFIGESVASADVATKFTNADCFVLCGEPGLYDELLLGNYDGAYDTEAYKGSYIVVNDLFKTNLTTFEGFTTDATPGFFKDWATGVIVVAENENGSPAVTYTPKAAELLDGSLAEGSRGTLFCRGQSAADFTDDAWKLFDAMINYAIDPSANAADPTSSAKTSDLLPVAMIGAITASSLFILTKKRR